MSQRWDGSAAVPALLDLPGPTAEPGRAPSLHAGYGMAEYLDVDIRSVQGPSRVEWGTGAGRQEKGKVTVSAPTSPSSML